MKKILSLLLVLTMVFSLSSTSFAAAGDSVPASGEEEIDNFYICSIWKKEFTVFPAL